MAPVLGFLALCQVVAWPAAAAAGPAPAADACALLQSGAAVGGGGGLGAGARARNAPRAMPMRSAASEAYRPAESLFLNVQEALRSESALLVDAVANATDFLPHKIEKFLAKHLAKCTPDSMMKVLSFARRMSRKISKGAKALSSNIVSRWKEMSKRLKEKAAMKKVAEAALQVSVSSAEAEGAHEAYLEGIKEVSNGTSLTMQKQNLTVQFLVKRMALPLERSYNETMKILANSTQQELPTECIHYADLVAAGSVALYNAMHNATLAVADELMRFNSKLQSISELAYEASEMTDPGEKLRALQAALASEVDKHVPAVTEALRMIPEEPNSDTDNKDEDEADDV